MDTLHERLARLADDAPTGGAPAAELWARGQRGHRLRVAAVAATLLVVGAIGTGIGVRLTHGASDHSRVEPAGPLGFALPIEYPAGKGMPGLGDSPGPLAAIWLAPRVGGGPSQVVGLVAESGTIGVLPIAVSYNHDETAPQPGVALSPDGRRIAYESLVGGPIVRDLVSGASYSPAFAFKIRAGYTWVDATHLVGHVAGGSDVDGWVWEPGTAPQKVNLETSAGTTSLGPYGGSDLRVAVEGGGPGTCTSPTLRERGGVLTVPVLCDVLGVIGPEILLGHWNSDRVPGDWTDPNDGNGTVVALNIQGAEYPFEDSALRQVVATAGAPERVTFATDLIAAALDADGGAS